MPHFIIKPDRDVDFYVDWSTIVDAPSLWGTQAELEDSHYIVTNDARFERADRTGTSAHWGEGAFDDDEFFVGVLAEEQFWVKRADLKAFCESLDPNDPWVYDRSLTRPAEMEDSE